MEDLVNQKTTETNQHWLAKAIALHNELAARSETIRDEMHRAERLHLRDLIDFAEKINSQAQSQLERTQQQKQHLQQQLQKVTQELTECRQELTYTQEDLVDALKSERLTLKQAKEFAKTLLAEDEPTREAMIRLLNGVYGSTLKPWDLGQRLPSQTNPGLAESISLSFGSAQLSPETIRLKAQFDQLRAKFVALKSQLARLQSSAR